jgi:hypothetical protein
MRDGQVKKISPAMGEKALGRSISAIANMPPRVTLLAAPGADGNDENSMQKSL